jgi:NAD(P)H dehydrogenase (quinone)
MSRTLLVTGAAGKLGRLTIEALIGATKDKIVAGTRDPAKLADLAARGVEVRRIDFDDADSLDAGFPGVDRLLIVSTDSIDRPGRRLEQHQRAIAAAHKAGVGHIVYTSMPKPEPGSAIIFAPDHFGTEQAIKASGLSYTILRVSWYQENLLMALPNALKSGQWFSAAGDGKVSHVAREDVARAAAAALASLSTTSETYDITSDEAFTTEEIAAIAAKATGKALKVVHVTDGQLIAGLQAHGVPTPAAAFIACFDTNTRLGGMTAPTDAVRKLTGRAPRRLEEYLDAHAADYV